MTEEKMIKVLNYYEEYLNNNYTSIKFDDYDNPNRKGCCSHLLYMIPEIKNFINDGLIDKANRWLGFIQGSLWTQGDFDLEELKDHNIEVEKPVINGRTYPKEIMEEAVKKTYYTLNGFKHDIEDIHYGHNLDPVALYPNKFKVVNHIDKVDGDGIYYINDRLPDNLITPLTKWIDDIYYKREVIPAGFNRACISAYDFISKYFPENNFHDYEDGRMSLDMCLSKCDLYYTNQLNPIRFLGTGTGTNIVLFDQIVKCNNIYKKTYTGINIFENNRISEIVTLMNLLNAIILINDKFIHDYEEIIKQLNQYLNQLINYRYIYDFQFLDYDLHIKLSNSMSEIMIINILQLEQIYDDLELLKGLVMK